MAGAPARDILIEGTWNARAFAAQRPWLIRSASLDELTDHGRRALDRLGVTSVVDLREPREIGVPGHRIPVRRLPVFGQLGEADPRATMEVAYRKLLELHGEALTQAVAAIARCDGAVAVHCAIGKDRTGLVVALALLAAGYSRDVIVSDYALSGKRQPTFLRRQAVDRLAWEGIEASTPAGREYLRRNLESPAEVMEGVLDYLEVTGGWRSYLTVRGLTDEDIEVLRSKAGLGLPRPTVRSIRESERVAVAA
jgi:hypothetical protein